MLHHLQQAKEAKIGVEGALAKKWVPSVCPFRDNVHFARQTLKISLIAIHMWFSLFGDKMRSPSPDFNHSKEHQF